MGLTGFFNTNGSLKSIGIQCALCHSTVDDSFAPGIGRRLDGWANRDLNVGLIASLAPNLQPVADLLSLAWADRWTSPPSRTCLRSWGPGKFDAGAAPGRQGVPARRGSAATLIPPAFGLAGVNLHTWTGWGGVSHWNAFVANLEMHGKGTFFDPRLERRATVPHRCCERGSGTCGTAPTSSPRNSARCSSISSPSRRRSRRRARFDKAAAARGKRSSQGRRAARPATCRRCSPSRAGTCTRAAEIGIDDFQANRSPDERYRTSPLKGLWTHTERRLLSRRPLRHAPRRGRTTTTSFLGSG